MSALEIELKIASSLKKQNTNILLYAFSSFFSVDFSVSLVKM